MHPGHVLRVTGLLMGVLASASCTPYRERYVGTAFLFNGTMRPQSMRLHRLQAPLDCTRPLEDPATWPGREAFALRACPMLSSRDILPLDQGWKDLGRWPADEIFTVEAPDAGIPGPTCDAVLLQADGLWPIVITWNGVHAIVFAGGELFGDSANDEHGLVLERAGERLFVRETTLLRVLPAGFDPAPADCPNGER